MKFVTQLIIFIALMISQVSANPISQVIAFEQSPRGHIIIPVTINDSYLARFVFDTGAGLTALNQNRLQEGMIDSSNMTSAKLNRAHVSKQTQKTTLESLQIASYRQTEIDAVMMDLSDVEAGRFEIEGIVGYNFFKHYDVHINYAKQTLELKPKHDKSYCADVSGVDFDLVEGTHIRFPLTLGSTFIDAILDTGSPRTGLNGYAADAIMPGATEQLAAAKKAHPNPQASTHGHADSFLGQLGIGSISVGDTVIAKNHPTNIVNLPVFESFGMGKSPGALVGVDLFKDRELNISYSCQKLHIL